MNLKERKVHIDFFSGRYVKTEADESDYIYPDKENDHNRQTSLLLLIFHALRWLVKHRAIILLYFRKAELAMAITRLKNRLFFLRSATSAGSEKKSISKRLIVSSFGFTCSEQGYA